MSATLTDRQHFRSTLAAVATKAKAVLPVTVNGRLESAVKLVLLGEVTVRDNGSIAVGSCTDPSKAYTLEGQTCTCTDFTQGKALQGWCKHRIAAGLHKRLHQVLAAEAPAQPLGATSSPLPEAPASVNCKVLISGIECQLTLRDTDEGRLLERLHAVLQRSDLRPVPKSPPGPRRPYNGQGGRNGQTIRRDYRYSGA
jgi:hypothetical protein